MAHDTQECQVQVFDILQDAEAELAPEEISQNRIFQSEGMKEMQKRLKADY